jgi:hypothetical protein
MPVDSLIRHPPDDRLVDGKLAQNEAICDADPWSCGLPGLKACDVGTLRAMMVDFVLIKVHRSLGFRWKQRYSSRQLRIGPWPQSGDEPQDVGEEVSRNSNLRHEEPQIVDDIDDLHRKRETKLEDAPWASPRN